MSFLSTFHSIPAKKIIFSDPTPKLDIESLMRSIDENLFDNFIVAKEALLVEESEAAKQAKRLKLHYIGFGKWATASGEYIAKTVDGKLKYRDPQYAEKQEERKRLEKAQSKYYNYTEYRTDVYAPKGYVMFKKIGGQTGTNPGGLYQSVRGEDNYVKFYTNPAQTKSEKLACDIYELLGLEVPRTHLIKDGKKIGISSRIITESPTWREERKRLLAEGDTEKVKFWAKTILEGFAADVLLANWDVVGLDQDNIRIHSWDAQVYRIDNGSSLLFRAQGEKKPTNIMDANVEWTGFADPNINAEYAQLFADAGYTKPEDLGFNLIKQIDEIAKESETGWFSFLLSGDAHGLTEKEVHAYTKILDTRTKFLLKKKEEMISQMLNSYVNVPKTKNVKIQLSALRHNMNNLAEAALEHISAEDMSKDSAKQTISNRLALCIIGALHKHPDKNPLPGDVADSVSSALSSTRVDRNMRMAMVPLIQNYLNMLRENGIRNLPSAPFLADPMKVSKRTLVEGETVINHNYYKESNVQWEEALEKLKGMRGNTFEREVIHTAAQQNGKKGWRSTLSDDTAVKLLNVQRTWQRDSVFKQHPSRRRSIYKVINNVVGNEKNPATFKTDMPLERGMFFTKRKHLELFLKNFAIGKTLALPPGGFTVKPYTARDFGNVDSMNGSSIVLRVHPKDNKIIGLNLAYTDEHATALWPKISEKKDAIMATIRELREKWTKENPEPKYPKTDPTLSPEQWNAKLNVYYKEHDSWQEKYETYHSRAERQFEERLNAYSEVENWYDNYNEEGEVIRPGNALMTVKSVTKHLYARKEGTVKGVYFIELEDSGLTNDPSLVREGATIAQKLAILMKAMLYKYAGGPLNQRTGEPPKKEDTK